MAKLALYTTVYPGVEPYLPAWYESVQVQSDRDVDLWIGVDALGTSSLEAVFGGSDLTWVPASKGGTPAEVRQKALSRMLDSYDAVIFVDSDDVMHPSRVAGARVAIEDCELGACAMRLIDDRGGDLQQTFDLPAGVDVDSVLPRNNVFGLSNSVMTTDLLRRCLPIPPEAILVDWYLATRAWLLGARLGFDPTVRMFYRQHGSNTARLRRPFSRQQIAEDAERVRMHFRLLLSGDASGSLPERRERVEQIAADVEVFCREVVTRPDKLASYLEALNALEEEPLWWSTVANPLLSRFWTSQVEFVS